MFKHTQTIRRQQPTNCLSVFEHFVGLALKGLIAVFVLTNSYLFKNVFFYRHFILKDFFTHYILLSLSYEEVESL